MKGGGTIRSKINFDWIFFRASNKNREISTNSKVGILIIANLFIYLITATLLLCTICIFISLFYMYLFMYDLFSIYMRYRKTV